MMINIKMLIKACEQLSYSYEIIDENSNLVMVYNQDRRYPFANWTTPLNSSSVSRLCEDKQYFYEYFKSRIKMPKTIGYLNPDCDPKYSNYLKYSNLQEIVKDIKFNFNYPVIIKKNRGSLGRNVFKCETQEDVSNALAKIYVKEMKIGDYIALAQDYIKIEHEYRVLLIDGELHCAYEKNIQNATYRGNLSPLHWDGAIAKLTQDPNLLEQFQNFCQPLFQYGELRYVGVDLAVDTDNNLWLIEANSSPGINYLIRDCGEEIAIEWYKKALVALFKRPG